MVTLVAAVYGGLLRLGWAGPVIPGTPYHGPLMVNGFLGTLIGLERAAALGRWWGYLAPASCLASAACLLGGATPGLAPMLFLLGSTAFLAGFIPVLRRYRESFVWVMAAGAVAWVIGNVVWLAGAAIPRAVPWWSGFLVLTIVGERLELSRFLGRTRGQLVAFSLATGLYGAGLLCTGIDRGLSATLMGLGLLATAAWLARFDLARHTIRQDGLPRFVAVAMLSGYAWLAAAGLFSIVGSLWSWHGASSAGLLHSLPQAGPIYDALVHALLIGFVFSMIFGHAPIIFPSVLGVRIRFSPLFYGHLALLHATLILRIAADLGGTTGLRQWGGLGNAVAVGIFLLVTLGSVRSRKRPTTEGPIDAPPTTVALELPASSKRTMHAP